MTRWLKQSTTADVVIGPFIDDTDGKTPETGLSIAQADCQLSKNGGAAAQKNSATAATHLGGGHYKAPLNTTDTNTLGQLRLWINKSGALPVWADFLIVPANVYDSLVGGSDKLQTDAVEVSGDATAADNLEAILDGTRAKLSLTQLDIVATGNNSAIVATGAGTGHGIAATGGATAGRGMKAAGGAEGIGLEVVAGAVTPSTGANVPGLKATGSGEGSGAYLLGGDENGSGLEVQGNGTGYGLWGYGDVGIKAENDGSTPAFMDNDQSVEDMVWDAVAAAHTDSGSTGEALGGGGGDGDVTSIDGSAAAAENLRKMFDGTGYAAAASSIGSVTNEVPANVLKVSNSTASAQRLGFMAQAVVVGIAVAGTLSTTEMTTSLTESTDNHWKPPSVVKWVSGALNGQSRAIIGYVGATKKLQYQATTEAPSAGDSFVIL